MECNYIGPVLFQSCLLSRIRHTDWGSGKDNRFCQHLVRYRLLFRVWFRLRFPWATVSLGYGAEYCLDLPVWTMLDCVPKCFPGPVHRHPSPSYRFRPASSSCGATWPLHFETRPAGNRELPVSVCNLLCWLVLLTCRTLFGKPVFCDNCFRSLASGLWLIAK